MDRMLVVVFDTEKKAYEGKKALMELDGEGSIVVYAYAVVSKDADGKVTVRQSDDAGPLDPSSEPRSGASSACSAGPRVSRSAQLWDWPPAAQWI